MERARRNELQVDNRTGAELGPGASVSLALTGKAGMEDGAALTAQAEVTKAFRMLADGTTADISLSEPIVAETPATLSILLIENIVDKSSALPGSIVNYIVCGGVQHEQRQFVDKDAVVPGNYLKDTLK